MKMMNVEKSKPIHMLIPGITWPPETFLIRLISGLTEAGVNITLTCDRSIGQEMLSSPSVDWLFTPGWQGSVPRRLLQSGKMLMVALVKAPGHVRLFATDMHNDSVRAYWRSWYRLLPFAGHHWDVIYFPWNSTAITYLPLFEFGAPVIISCRGSQVNVAPHNPQRHSIRDGLQRTFQKAAAIHCVSDAIKQEAMLYGLDADKTRVIRPAVDPDFFRPRPKRIANDRPFRVITVGSLKWPKGYEYALSAIRRLVDKSLPVRYEIIGDGPERQRILYTIHDLGLTEYVRLVGRLSPPQVRNRLQQADAFLLPSLSEGIANVALEAMACALPVVSTDCGGMREAITHGQEGFIVPTRDADALAEALMTLANAPEHRHSMGQAGRRRVLGQFQLSDQVEQFLNMMNSSM